jgi:hypothetical protein
MMSKGRTIRRITDPKVQRLEAYRYWQSRTVAERMEAVDEVVREAYFAKGIDLRLRPSNRKLVHVIRPGWKAV